MRYGANLSVSVYFPSDKMEQLNQEGSSSSLIKNKKRGRPRRDESQTDIDENLIGQVVSGVVEGSFEAGYFLNVKVANTEKQLQGIVFLPERVTPITPTTDLFPQAKMYSREHQRKKDIRTQTIVCAEEKLAGGQTLSLMPQFTSHDVPKEDRTSEACTASKTSVIVTTTSIAQGSTTLVDFFPSSGAEEGSTLSLGLFQNEIKRSETEQEKSIDLMVDEKQASDVDDVPEELQLELGNTKMNGSAIATEANHQ